MPDWRACSVEWEDTRQASLLVQFGSHGLVRAGWYRHVISLVESEEERKERLRRLAKERVQEVVATQERRPRTDALIGGISDRVGDNAQLGKD